ncbi:hypothetical protein [Spirochaeta lutea]|uniref:Uncharacterized protein n=1 Tax=Spirochaeta lutea TaxID=1480694 RepID=A0A098R1R4_9SPIO|nr:hypothetical protein [Spirochaeta lutea]KGE73904.1 hypothetical protein DC28_01505 [Spirochaeta lutea]
MTISDTNPMNPVKPFSGLKPTLVVLTSLVLLGLGSCAVFGPSYQPDTQATDLASLLEHQGWLDLGDD